jgi:hypothetical protein
MQMTQIAQSPDAGRKPRGPGKSIEEKIAEAQRQLKTLEQKKVQEEKKAAKAAAEKKRKEISTQRAQQKEAEKQALLDLTKWLKSNELHLFSLEVWDTSLSQIKVLLGKSDS